MPPEAVVHVIDDDEAVRESLSFLLRSAKLQVQSYESALAFLNALPGLGAGCIITDVRMPELGGIELLRRLRDRGITMPVIVMTGHGDVPLAVEAMKIGAVDFFEKPFDDDALLAAVREALGNWEKGARQGAERAELQERVASLTNRERDVLNGLIAGNPNKIMAHDFGISPRTVEIYRANVMTKMKAASLSELVRMALRAGILDTGPKA